MSTSDSNKNKVSKDNSKNNSTKTETKKKGTSKVKEENKKVKKQEPEKKDKSENKKETSKTEIVSKKKKNETSIKNTEKEIETKKENNEIKKEIQTQIKSQEINLKPRESKLVKNEFTSTIDIKEIIKAIPKKTHKKEEVENAIADIFDVEYNGTDKEKNEKLEKILEKTQDFSIIREEIKRTETTSKEYNKNDAYLIDEINHIESNVHSTNDKNVDLSLKEEIKDTKIETKSKVWMFISFILILLLLVLTVFIIHHFNTAKHDVTIVEKKILDENYIFLGDSITELYKLDDYYQDFKVVNSGKSGYRTSDILSKLDTMVYDYNPTKVFLLIGTNDFLNKDVTTYEIYKNITKIIEEIQKNRRYAKIYVESIYPTCHHDEEKVNLEETNKRPNKKIKEINQKLKEYCEKNDITYIDVYSKLLDEDGELKLDYTVDGLHLSEDGYDVVSKTLMPYVKEDIEY